MRRVARAERGESGAGGLRRWWALSKARAVWRARESAIGGTAVAENSWGERERRKRETIMK